MSSNQQIILDTLLEQKRIELEPTSNSDDFFEFFVTEQLLKDAELSYDEIEQGVVDNGGDGGIDTIYTFVNSDLVQKDTDLIEGKRNSIIEINIIQAKNTMGFGETAVEKFISSALDLFDFTKSIDSLKTVYNADLLQNIDIFRKQYLHLASKFPILKFQYYYVTKGTEIHQNVERKVENLKTTLTRLFDKAEVNFEFITAQKLIELSRREQLQSKDILLTDNPISTQDGGYIAIVPLKNYYNFIVTESGELIKYFFDANIRDYQGKVEVNVAIRETLKTTNPGEDFWWLNNGITITATNATFASKKLHIEDPQIVNGLQTSFEIYNYFRKNKIDVDTRNVLVRVIKADNEKSRLKVIKATNSQTNIPPASLRATDPIHRDIEDFLLSNGYYYDRRKNYHKNQGKPIKKIISIPFLAQIIMSILHQKPDYARARPSTLIKNNSDYEDIFSTELPISIYLKAVQLHLAVEAALKAFTSPALSRTHIGDIKFHVSMYLCCRLLKKQKASKSDLEKLDMALLTPQLLNEAIETVYLIYDTMGGNNAIAKGKEFVKEVLEQLTDNNSRQG
jgi:AIPR protein